jgi:hypothetical protein
MNVRYDRGAGLDLHQELLIACLRIVAAGEAIRECRTFGIHDDIGLEAVLGWRRAGVARRRSQRPGST